MKKITDFVGEYRFLSNFYPDGPGSIEHLFQAFKCESLADAQRVLNAPTPGEAKKIGRTAKMRSDWEDNKVTLMYSLVRDKFKNHYLRSLLLETGDAELIEENTWGDKLWGTCNGVGENLLGKILMRVRNELRS